MTSAEYRALNAPKASGTDPRIARTPAPKGKTQPEAHASIVAPEIPKSEILTAPSVASQYYIGPYQLAVANGTHFPGRMRFVGVGPADEGLLRAVLDTIQAYHDSKTVKP